MPPKIKLYKNKEWLFRMYHIEKLTEEEIAKFCGVTRQTINNALHELKIPIRKR